MTSTMYFKFRAMKAYETLLFDGHFLSVGELKQLIAEKRGLLGVAAELVLSDPPDGPEYNDDNHQIPKGGPFRMAAVISL
jgi:E3 ubiquitin-protein ligase RBBP6